MWRWYGRLLIIQVRTAEAYLFSPKQPGPIRAHAKPARCSAFIKALFGLPFHAMGRRLCICSSLCGVIGQQMQLGSTANRLAARRRPHSMLTREVEVAEVEAVSVFRP